MVPEQFLIDFCRVKNQICNFVFKNYEKPDDYEHMVSLAKVLTEIKNKKLNIDLDQLSGDLHKFKVRQFVKKTKTLQPYITYDQFKAKTGRLTTKRSFPILTMDKTYRKILKPNNDWFVEFDFNAAELRVLLGLLGEAQPQQDIHDWNAKNVYQGQITRDEAKKRIFAWLYNPASKDHLSSRIYKREAVVNKYYNNGQVTNFFNRKIEADEHHAPNYIIQSTAADLFLRQMIKLWEALKDKKSYIAFCLHDSLVIDFSEEDQFSLNDLKEIFAQTALGKFKVNVSAGKNYGDMKKLKVY
jgi:DNA polymerase I-like protein with 3'-5' exonuclease and polymerase domains